MPPRRSSKNAGLANDVFGVLAFVWTHPANRGSRLRALTRALVFQLRGRLLHRRTLARLGARSWIWAELHRTGASKAVYANPPDHPEMLVWSRWLHPGDLFVDVGANIGTYTIWAAEVGAEVIAVEPAPDTCDLLRENVMLNGYVVEILEAAAGASGGEAGFTSGKDCVNQFDPDGHTRVRTVTLDEVIGDRIVGGLKIDVEGFEIEVLRGCKRALEEGRIRLLQLEWNSTSEAAVGSDRSTIAELLFDVGYQLYRPTATGELAPIVGSPPYGRDVFARRRVDAASRSALRSANSENGHLP